MVALPPGATNHRAVRQRNRPPGARVSVQGAPLRGKRAKLCSQNAARCNHMAALCARGRATRAGAARASSGTSASSSSRRRLRGRRGARRAPRAAEAAARAMIEVERKFAPPSDGGAHRGAVHVVAEHSHRLTPAAMACRGLVERRSDRAQKARGPSTLASSFVGTWRHSPPQAKRLPALSMCQCPRVGGSHPATGFDWAHAAIRRGTDVRLQKILSGDGVDAKRALLSSWEYLLSGWICMVCVRSCGCAPLGIEALWRTDGSF